MKSRVCTLFASGLASLLIVVALLGLFINPVPVLATTLTVGSDCLSLDDCIVDANAGDTIQIPAGSFSTNVTVTKRLTFSGAEMSTTILDGGNSGRIIYAPTNVPITLTQMTIQNGTIVTSTGGAIYTTGALVLDEVTVQNNSAPNAAGIWTSGELRITNSVFTNNQCTESLCTGGGIYATASTHISASTFITNTGIFGAGIWTSSDLTVINSSFTNNLGGGIRSIGPTLFVQNNQFADNSAGEGGGIHAGVATDVAIEDSYFNNNYCNVTTCRGGALFSYGSASISNSTLFSNTAEGAGGAAWIQGSLIVSDTVIEANACTLAGCTGGGISSDENLTISNSSLISGNIANGDGGGIYAFADITINESHFQQNASGGNGGGAWANRNASVYSSTIFDNQATNVGGGIFAGNGITITNSTVNSNSVSFNGGGLASFGSLVMTTTAIYDNQATNGGGGASADGDTQIANSQFHDNRSTTGGALFVGSNSHISGTTFADNHASGNGGAVLIGGSGTIINVTVMGNIAEIHGGGVYASALAVYGSQFSDNEAALRGGGIYAVNALTIELSTIDKNVAGFLGGGATGDEVVILTSTFSENRCSGDPCLGGGLATDTSLLMSDSLFVANTTAGIGGGVYVVGPSNINETFFTENVATLSGGGVYHDITGQAEYTNVILDNNQATNPGSAIHINNNDVVTITHSTIANRLTNNGSGVWNQNGNLTLINSIVAYHNVGINNDAIMNAESSLFFDNNTDVTGAIIGPGNLFSDPAFSAPEAGNYNLDNGSNAIDVALPTNVTIDIMGNARPFGVAADIGAIEAGYDLTSLIVEFVSGPIGELLPGQPVTFTISYANEGNVTARDVMLTNILPSTITDISYVSSRPITPTGNSTYVWNVSDLPPLASGLITVTGRISTAIASLTTITNNVSILNATGLDDDIHILTVAPPLVQFVVTTLNVTELDSFATLSLTLSAPNPYADVVVQYQTVDGSALAGEDYVATNATITFPAGSSIEIEQIQIAILRNIQVEMDETFTVPLLGIGAVAQAPAEITILDSDYGVYLPVVIRSD